MIGYLEKVWGWLWMILTACFFVAALMGSIFSLVTLAVFSHGIAIHLTTNLFGNGALTFFIIVLLCILLIPLIGKFFDVTRQWWHPAVQWVNRQSNKAF